MRQEMGVSREVLTNLLITTNHNKVTGNIPGLNVSNLFFATNHNG